MFEWGVATTMVGRRYRSTVTEQDLVDVHLRGYEALFRDSLHYIFGLNVYDLFQKVGWNWRVARIVHTELMAEIHRAVRLSRYVALL